MKKWKLREISIILAFNLLLILLMQLIAAVIRYFGTDTMTSLRLFCFVPLIFSAVFTYIIKSKDKRIWILETILAVFVGILLLYSWKQPFRPDFIDPETFGFSILFTLLHSGGIFIGSWLGYLAWFLKGKFEKR